MFSATVHIEDTPRGPVMVAQAAVMPEVAANWERRIMSAIDRLEEERDDAFFRIQRRRFRSAILLREVLPNIATHLAVVATLEMALAILLEAALSFLGLGVPPPLPSWGLMIAEAKEYMFFSPWVIMIPGIALFVLVLGINLLGDGLRDMMGTDLSR